MPYIFDADDLIEVAIAGGSVTKFIEKTPIDNKKTPKNIDPDGPSESMDFQQAAVEIGKAIPKILLAMKSVSSMEEKRVFVGMLERAVDAQMYLSAYSSNASQYSLKKAGVAVERFNEVVKEARKLSDSLSFPVVGHFPSK